MLGPAAAAACRWSARCPRGLSQPILCQARCSPFATGPRQDVGTIFELRTYDIKPAKSKEFLELVNRDIHVRMAHSEMIGFWTAELGSMNTAFHIWKYDNFAHRAAVRKAIANDKEWQEKLSAILPLLKKQEMEIAYLVPWCELGIPPKEGVYELVTYQQKPGGPALWGQSFKAAIDAHVSKNYAKLIGVFHTEYGLLNTEEGTSMYSNPFLDGSIPILQAEKFILALLWALILQPLFDHFDHSLIFAIHRQKFVYFGGMRTQTAVRLEGIVPMKMPGW